ncbi:MAG: TetR/AcrR family transcriptional regulator, partial [Betaproteobacteria bacterium]|nr:TetR/AcrR family transcriptional regulator [Betaproteobacteria bacterium]
LLREAQAEGVVVRAPIPRLLAFLAGAVGAPIVLGAAAVRVSAGQRAAFAPLVQRHVLGDAAIAQRVDFALRGILTAGAAS